MIDPACRADARAINQIARQADVFSPNELESVSAMLDAFFDPSPDDDHLFVVYRSDATVLGFACYGPIPFTQASWELYWICVERSRQRNSVGRELLNYVCVDLRARGARALYLETSDAEPYRPARSFYERAAFVRLAHLEDFYARGEGKQIYRKMLDH